MDTYRLGYRNANGDKNIAELDGVSSYHFAREFVIREAQAVVCLALVNPVQPKPSPELAPFDGEEAA